MNTTHKQAKSFVRILRDTLHEKEQDVEQLTFQLLRDFRSGKIKPKEVAAKAKEILKGHDDLIAEFNVFLPDDYKIDIDNAEPIALEGEAENLIKMVKVRHEDKYEDFLKSLVMYLQGKKEMVQVCNEITCILSNSPDLLKIFNKFLEPKDLYKRYGNQVTTSYKLLLVKPSQSSQVLNNTCACVIKNNSSEKSPSPKKGLLSIFIENVLTMLKKKDFTRTGSEKCLSR